MKHVSILMAVAVLLSIAAQEVSANQPMSAVSGAVYDQAGDPVENAIVKFAVKTERRGLVVIETTTNEDGKYHIERLPAGRGRAKIDAGTRGAVSRLVKLEPYVLNIENFQL